MGDMRDFFEPYKTARKERIAKNPQRLAYAVKKLTENGITFKVCDEASAQINAYFANGKHLTFYAGTGKIQGYTSCRGIDAFLKLCIAEKGAT